MTFEEYATDLRKKFLSGELTDEEIANKINRAKVGSRQITDKEKEIIISYFQDPSYGSKTGRRAIMDSDNSALMRLINRAVQTIRNNTKS